MGNYRTPLFIAGLCLFLLAILVGSMWFNYRFAEQNQAVNKFLPYWSSTRAFLLYGQSPYSKQTTRASQELAYGRPAKAGQNELRAVYPLYSAILYAPFAMIKDYLLARTAWMTVLEIALVLLVITSLRMTGWQLGMAMTVLLALFTLLWYHSVRPLINGDAAILVALLISTALWAIKTGRDEVAGTLLAFATIKPHLVVLLVAFTFIWAVSAQRWRIVVAFLGILAFLFLGMMLFIPDWPVQNLREILRYPSYMPPGSPGAILAARMPGVGRQVNLAVTLILSAFLFVEWIAARGKEVRWYLWTACLTLVLGQWIGIPTEPGNFIILFPALILVLGMLEERWGMRVRWVSLASLFLLGGGLWAMALLTAENGVPSLLLFLPLPTFLIFGLYWVRWWAIRPIRPLLDQLRISETEHLV